MVEPGFRHLAVARAYQNVPFASHHCAVRPCGAARHSVIRVGSVRITAAVDVTYPRCRVLSTRRDFPDSFIFRPEWEWARSGAEP